MDTTEQPILQLQETFQSSIGSFSLAGRLTTVVTSGTSTVMEIHSSTDWISTKTQTVCQTGGTKTKETMVSWT